MTEKKIKVAVIGGGVAGITASSELSKSEEYSISLYERNTKLGGLIQSVEINDLVYDIGAFHYPDHHALLHSFPFLKDKFLSIANNPIIVRDDNKRDNYPISLKGYKENFGTTNFALSILSLLAGKIKYSGKKTLPDFCKYYLGSRVYNKSGLGQYIQRLYKKQDDQIDVKFGLTRMHRLSHYGLRELFKRIGSLNKEVTVQRDKRRCFVRPKGGFDVVFSALEDHLRTKDNITIRLGTNITKIEKRDDKFVIFCDGEERVYDRIISSAPVTVMQRLLGIEQDFTPQYIKLISFFYTGNFIPDSNIVYNFSSSGEWKRIICFSKYYGKENGKDYFSVEITAQNTDDAHVEMCKKEFEEFVVKNNVITDLEYQGIKINPFAYPIFVEGEGHLADREIEKIRETGVDLIGRQGTFEYIASHATILKTQDFVHKNYGIELEGNPILEFRSKKVAIAYDDVE